MKTLPTYFCTGNDELDKKGIIAFEKKHIGEQIAVVRASVDQRLHREAQNTKKAATVAPVTAKVDSAVAPANQKANRKIS